MIDTLLKTLETLSKYGIIDIIFGVGIFTLLPKLLKRRKATDLVGVDLIPSIDNNGSCFMLMIKNQSSEPLYLYQAYIKPGYYASELDKTSLRRIFITSLVNTWKTDRFPKVSGERKTTKGLYILQLINDQNGYAPTLFIEPHRYQTYKLDLGTADPDQSLDFYDIFEKHQFGVFKVNFVHGTKSGQLEVQI
jgi:hypothetical protein